MEPMQGERGGWRKKECWRPLGGPVMPNGLGRLSHAMSDGVTPVSHTISFGVTHVDGWVTSYHSAWHTSTAGQALALWATLVHMTWLLYKSRQAEWRDWKWPTLKKNWSGSFLEYLFKNGQNKKNQYGTRLDQWSMAHSLKKILRMAAASGCQSNWPIPIWVGY
jgi:hypothetical protein